MIVRTEVLDVAEAVAREQHTKLFTVPTAHDELIIADALIAPPDKFVALGYQQEPMFSIELGDTCEGLPRSVETRFLKRGSSSGTPYSIQTGFDDNGDLIFNDRPAGVGRNTARAATQYSLNIFASYGWTFGPRLVLPGGPMIYGTPAGVNVTSFAPPPQGRYRISFNANVSNLTNHTNLTGYSGVITSPFFGLPTAAINPRRVNVGLQLGF